MLLLVAVMGIVCHMPGINSGPGCVSVIVSVANWLGVISVGDKDKIRSGCGLDVDSVKTSMSLSLD
jgi:hypothetical protein